MRRLGIAGAVVAMVAAPAAAQAQYAPTLVTGTPRATAPPAKDAQGQPATATADVYMRAQPNESAATVEIVPAGSAVMVYGCLDNWSWCDISWGPNRGWVAGAYFITPYQDAWLPVAYAFPYLGVPMATFGIGGYWGGYYGARLWYPYWYPRWPYYGPYGGYWGPYRPWASPYLGVGFGIGYRGYWGPYRRYPARWGYYRR